MTGSDAGKVPPEGWRGPLYLDASALAKRYLPEEGSDALEARLVDRRDLVVSELAITEIVSAFARGRRAGEVSAETATVLRSAILADVEAGHYLRVELTPSAHREAERILLSASAALRAADALHLALALSAGAAAIVTFDRTMGAATASFGLTALPG